MMLTYNNVMVQYTFLEDDIEMTHSLKFKRNPEIWNLSIIEADWVDCKFWRSRHDVIDRH